MDKLVVRILKEVNPLEGKELLDLYNKLQDWCRCCHCGPVEHEEEEICCRKFTEYNRNKTYNCILEDPVGFKMFAYELNIYC